MFRTQPRWHPSEKRVQTWDMSDSPTDLKASVRQRKRRAIKGMDAARLRRSRVTRCGGQDSPASGEGLRVDVLPAKRGEMGEQRVRDQVAAAAHDVQRAAEIDGVPQRDGGRDKGKSTGAMLLSPPRTGA